MKKRIDIIEQMEHSECGMVCLAMILKYHDRDITMPELRVKYGIPTGGLNLLQMAEILKDFDLSCKGIRVKDIKALNNSYTPFIAFWNDNHFVIVEEIGDRIKIIDPSRGRKKVTLSQFHEHFSEKILLVEDNKKGKYLKKDTNKQNKYKLFINEINRNKSLIIFIVLLTVILQFIIIFITQSIGKLTDLILSNNKVKLEPFYFQLFTIMLLYYISSIIRTISVVRLQVVVDKNLMKRVIHHLLKVPIQFYTSRSKGELLFRINSNSYIRQILSEKLINIIIDIMFILVYIVALIKININLTFIVIVVGFIIFIISIIYTRKFKNYQQNQIIHSTNTQSIITELINNIDTIKVFGVEDEILKKWENSFLTQMKYEEKKAKLTGFIGSLPVMIRVFFPALIYLIGGIYVSDNMLSIGELIAFNTIGGLFLGPILSLSSSYSDIEVVKIFFNKILDILLTTKQKPGNQKVDVIKGDIEINNLYFQYNKLSPYVLKNINIKIDKGEKIAIVGESGSGKSTLLKLMCRLYDPTEGEILFDNILIKGIRNKDFYNNIGVVLQEPQIFSDSIRENILLFRTNLNESLIEIIQELEIDKMVEGSSIGINTILSEDGINFSGGQRQRISLARSMVHQPNLLFLDEPTSSLDNKAERRFMDYLLSKRFTCVVIAHRFYNIESFDKIIVMYKGEIVGQGEHKELLVSCKYYQDLYLKEDNEAE